MKKRDTGIDLIRVVSALGIVLHHYSRELAVQQVNTPHLFGGDYATGNFGWLFVTVFFMISGMSLFANYSSIGIKEVLPFYKKRWLSIFPSFYFVWMYLYIGNVLTLGKFLYGGKIYCFIWTILGVDGYVNRVYPTYYLIGEWFLGAIIILYILYPLVLKLLTIKKLWIVFSLLLVVLFELENHFAWGIQTGPFRGIFSCLLSFCIGMLLMKEKKILKNKILWGVSIVGSILLLAFPITILDANITVHILGLFLTVALYNLGCCFENVKFVNEKMAFIAKLSYPIFLIHHVVIYKVGPNLKEKDLNVFQYFFFYVLIVVLVFALAWALNKIVRFDRKKKEGVQK